jgi:cytochrome P450
MACLDGADHRRVRGAAQPAFTPSRIRALTARIQELADDLLNELAFEQDPNLHQVASQLPLLVIMDLLGAPRADAERLRQLSRLGRWKREYPWAPASVRRGHADLQESHAYFAALVEQHRREPRENLTSALIEAHDAGAVDDEELPVQLEQLVLAAHETTRTLLAGGMLELLLHREQWEKLCADPTVASTAVEEILRFTPPVPLLLRIAQEELDVAGVQVPKGWMVMVQIEAANRDEGAFVEPDRFDIARTPNDHLTFGHGAHFCLGAPLARLEAHAFISGLALRYPDIEFAVPRDDVESVTRPSGRRIESLPVKLHA